MSAFISRLIASFHNKECTCWHHVHTKRWFMAFLSPTAFRYGEPQSATFAESPQKNNKHALLLARQKLTVSSADVTPRVVYGEKLSLKGRVDIYTKEYLLYPSAWLTLLVLSIFIQRNTCFASNLSSYGRGHFLYIYFLR